MPGEAVTTARQVLDRLLDERLHRQLLTIALAIVRDPTVAEEVVQDVYAAVLDEGSTLADVSDAEVYLRACVRNETRRRAGELHRRSTRTAEIDEGRVECTRPSVPDCYLVEREIPAILPRHLRRVYKLWHGGMTQEDMAAELGCSRSTVQRRWTDLCVALEELFPPPETLIPKAYLKFVKHDFPQMTLCK